MWTRRSLCKLLVLGGAWSLSGGQPRPAGAEERFLELSARLCGVPRHWLSSAAGQVYRAELESWGVDWPALRPGDEHAARLVRWWYSGCCEADGGDRRVHWDDTLMWRLSDWTGPTSQCGSPGSWARWPS